MRDIYGGDFNNGNLTSDLPPMFVSTQWGGWIKANRVDKAVQCNSRLGFNYKSLKKA